MITTLILIKIMILIISFSKLGNGAGLSSPALQAAGGQPEEKVDNDGDSDDVVGW